MTTENILCEVAAGVATVTINRPEKLNALDAKTIRELDACFAALAVDAAARVVVVTGAGPKAFVAGADISELATLAAAPAQELSRRGQALMDRIEHLGKPVIAAVNGFALGGGCELALACSFRWAADTAKLGLPETGLGLIPGYGGTQRLPAGRARSRARDDPAGEHGDGRGGPGDRPGRSRGAGGRTGRSRGRGGARDRSPVLAHLALRARSRRRRAGHRPGGGPAPGSGVVRVGGRLGRRPRGLPRLPREAAGGVHRSLGCTPGARPRVCNGRARQSGPYGSGNARRTGNNSLGRPQPGIIFARNDLDASATRDDEVAFP
ncbi:MAG: enoyl-CoA hydratase/isomerase family protein [bacterium]|nr:enoyl-CoA hydratase/isomerase family protein [bacterium]